MKLSETRDKTVNGLKRVELKQGTFYPFVALTDKFGLAEFSVCSVYIYGKLREIFFYPLQQPDAKEYYHAEFNYSPVDWSVSSWRHKGMDDPRVWVHFWCKEHKCPSMRVYVPRNSKGFTVNFYSNFSINFDKDES